MRNKGWTVIELVMVIVIIAIIAVASIPRFEAFYSIKLQSGVKRALADIRYTQELSIARHENYKIVFNTGTESYQVQRVSDSAYAIDPFTRVNLIVNFSTDPEHKGINIASTNLASGTVQFDWQGIPYDVNGAALTAEASIVFTYKDYTNTIYITPQTGIARIE